MKLNLTLFVLLICSSVFSQEVQQRLWFFGNNQKIDFTTGTPVANNLTTFNTYSSSGSSGSSISNPNGERILYTDGYGAIYSKYGVIGAMDKMLQELGDPLIVPKPGSDCIYYVIYTTASIDIPDYEPVCPGAASVYFNIFYNEVDLTGNNGFGTATQSIPLDICSNSYSHAPYAVSKEINGERFMYTLAQESGIRKIRKFVISTNGIIENPIIFSFSNLAYFKSIELELSHDRSKLAFANIDGNEVYVIHLDANGNLANTEGTNGDGTSLFNIPITGAMDYGLTGLEFSDNENFLYVGGRNDGIFRIDVQSGVPPTSTIPGTDLYGISELELGFDPSGDYKMYALSRQLNGANYEVHMGQIGNINSVNPSFSPSVIVGLTPYNYNELIWPTAFLVLHLPEQIDGENYEDGFIDLTGSCCAAMDGFDVLNYTALVNATWTNVLNPFGNLPIVKVQTEIRIPAGRIVQMVDMEFQFSEQGKLVIEPGAKLILTRTTLTSMNCDGLMWQGVELQGNASIDQTPFSQQGYLIMQDNSEISNAYNGISVYGRDASNNVNWQQTGGVVQATNSFFRNNIRDVEFLAYSFKNYSYFRNCSFLTDAAINNGAYPREHVYMYLIDGVRFTGCNFKNTTTGLYTDNFRGYGIRSNESKYYVGYHCNIITTVGTPCPDANKVGCVFENLFFGIRAEGGPSFRPVDIRYNDFINNTRGIYLGGTDFSYVVNNTINVAAPISYAYGLYLDNCTGYSVENNQFTTLFPTATYGALVVNSNSGGTTPDVNEIYRNTFDGFDYSATAALPNVQMLNGNPVTNTGLTFKCNSFNDSKQFDILTVVGGISPFQGSCATVTSGANNQFSVPPALIGDFWNANSVIFQMNYRYENGGGLSQTEPRDPYMNWINTTKSQCLTTFNPATSCPQRRFDLTKWQIKQKILQTQVFADNLIVLIDGGNTASLLSTINSATNPIIIRNALLGASPYLSDEVLIALINKIPALPNGILKQIILANSPVSNQVQSALDAIQLPVGINQQISVAQVGISAMNELQSDISFWSRESNLYYDELIRVYLHDSTLVGNEDSVKVLLANSDKLMYNKYRLAALNIKMKQYVEAESLINELRLLNDTKLEDYCNYLDVVMDLEQTEKKCHTLETDPVRRNVVEGLAAKLDESKDYYAATIMLKKVFGVPYEEFIPFYMDASNKMMQTKPNSKEILEIKKVNIYPNPTNDFVTIELLLDDNIMLNALVYDLTGKLMLTGEVSNQRSYLDVSSIKEGTYLLVINMADGTVITEKLIKTK